MFDLGAVLALSLCLERKEAQTPLVTEVVRVLPKKVEGYQKILLRAIFLGSNR